MGVLGYGLRARLVPQASHDDLHQGRAQHVGRTGPGVRIQDQLRVEHGLLHLIMNSL
jgi:hypothetical protein